jgi:uncharacterized small protein (DUF1192 family)
MNKEEEEENEKSIYNYNMIFNRINNYDEDIKFNTNLISDIDLQNFDPKRYEYYTNLLYIYNKDPKTLYDLLNKYYSVKSLHEKEKGLIKYIYDYARKLRDAEGDAVAAAAATAEGEGGGGGGGGGGGDAGGGGGGDAGGGGGGRGGSIRRRNKRRRNRQAGGVNTWQNKFIDVLKTKMPDKVEKKKDPKPEASADEKDDDGEYYTEKEGVGNLSERIKLLEKEIKEIKTKNNPSLGSTLYNDIKERFKKLYNNSKNKKIVNEMSELKDINKEIKDLISELTDLKITNAAGTQDVKIKELEETIKKLQDEQVTLKRDLYEKVVEQLSLQENITGNRLSSQDIRINDLFEELESLNIVHESTSETETASPRTPPRPLMIQPPAQQVPATITASLVKDPPEPLSESLEAVKDIVSSLITGIPPQFGGAGNSDDKLKMKYLDNNKYKDIISWKELRKLKGYLKTQPESIDENNKIARLSQDIDNYNFSGKTKDDDNYIIQQLNNFENDPKNPLDELAITFDDRLVFIIATFFIRYITIIIVQWCIDINIIKTFYEGFIYYAIIYIIIFWFIVLFINIDNGYDVKYMNFNGIINSIRTLFYYFYMGTNGISRLLVHTSLIIILIIIPIILNIKRKADYVDDEQTETEKILDNEERKQLSKSLSLFTMFIWLFTSIIATKF